MVWLSEMKCHPVAMLRLVVSEPTILASIARVCVRVFVFRKLSTKLHFWVCCQIIVVVVVAVVAIVISGFRSRQLPMRND